MYLFDTPVGSVSAYSLLFDYSNRIFNGKVPENIDWQVIFLIGLFMGAVISGITGKSSKLQLFPEDHMSRGPAFCIVLGPVLMFIGGFLVMAGLIIAGNTFLKLWCDSLGLCMVVGLFIIIMFVEAVVIGTLTSLKIEEKK